MKTKSLTRYILSDETEMIADRRGTIVAERNNGDYLPIKLFLPIRIKSSISEKNMMCKEIGTPKTGDYLVTYKEISWAFSEVNISEGIIKEIDKNFSLESTTI